MRCIAKYRHPETKRRAELWPVFGTWSYSVTIYEYRAKNSSIEHLFKYKCDALAFIAEKGYK